MELLINNGTIVNANNTSVANVLCRDNKIVGIGDLSTANTSVDRIIDATDCYVIPGGIDPHVHMHLPSSAGFSSDDFYSGSKAALFGGTTSIIDFVTPRKGESLQDAILKRTKESQNCLTNYSFHVSPIEWRDTIENEIDNCISKGLRSFKVYMAYKDTIGLDDEVLLKVMKTVGNAGGMVTVHCELGDEIEILRNKFASVNCLIPEFHSLSRPSEVEAKAVEKAINFAKEAQCPIYIVHVSTKESLVYIREAQKNGQKVYAETCPQYLLLDDSKYIGDFENTGPFVMSPPLRKKEDIDALWEAVSDGTIQTVGTDHCPFNFKQKETGRDDFRKIPNGAGGVENRLALLYTYGVLKDKISLNQFVDLTSTNVAKIFGLYPEKGIIEVGSDADLVIWNPKIENIISASNHHQNCDINIYEGIKTIGSPRFVIQSGRVVVENGLMISTPSKGQLLVRR
ncbi:MAG: dihydropyrimidinase [Bacteroidetes bacterium]|nr:dihydropyrimidinase [Bacteroidota bacterium]